MPASGPAFASLTADDHVTGEAVALDLPPASLGSRIGSGLIDAVVTVVLLVVVFLTFGIAALRSDGALAHVALVGTLVTVFLVVPTTVETLTRGRSLGKLACGLRTVRDDAGPISFQHAFVRALIGFVEIYAFSGAPAFFCAMLSARGQRFGDHAAGTYVVRERVRLRLAAPALLPAHLAGWARGADMASLPTGLALAVRQYLGRAASLDPATRHDLGSRLAAEVGAYVAPPPPAGTAPQDFLAAVIASRRERDSARLAREDAMRTRLVGGR
ncbi:RDD family protein [Nocardioides currus]|uniref:RDD family protein n=1 Tax=Nocardioides currus TaxID=2133958 RepID=A0A2R7Z0H5_9ACTN|nr:RDD family protein [Nocardioides currus]PUA82123.1 RDD family protein [Nocardioides currus]